MMAVTKKLRFEVFKRDGFKCAYCGRTPPSVTLEADHIDPKSKGGKDDINNLITACFDCNRGKTNIPLNVIPETLLKNLEILKEKESQIREYRKYIKKIDNRINKDVEVISQIYSDNYPDWLLTDRFKSLSLKRFIKHLPLSEVKDAMERAINRFPDDSNSVIKYFCGIYWNKIRGD
ncbi:HNH endonuclease [bacterium]|nr:HNH endonuclease [bacterium]